MKRAAWLAPLALSALALPTPSQDEVRARMGEALALSETDRAAAARELAALAPVAPQAFVDALLEERDLDRDGLLASPGAALLSRALAGLELQRLEQLFTTETGTDLRRAGLTTLLHVDGLDALDLAIDLARDPGQGPPMAGALESVATSLHRRSERVGAGLPHRIRAVELPLVEPLIRALVAVEGPRTTERVAELLGHHTACDPLLLSNLTRLVGPDPELADERVRRAAGPLLASPDAEVRREAATAVGRLEDFDAVPDLIDALEDPHGGVVHNAVWALERLSGLRLGAERDRWRVWWTLNQRWWDEQWPGVRASLRVGDLQETTEALRSLGGRRFRRHAIASEVARILGDTDDEHLLIYTCLTLSALDSVAAAPRVARLLADPRQPVRDAALSCLRELTGVELPGDPALWNDHFDRDPLRG